MDLLPLLPRIGLIFSKVIVTKLVDMFVYIECRISRVLRSTSEKMSNASFDPSLFVSINPGRKCQIIQRNDETIDDTR